MNLMWFSIQMSMSMTTLGSIFIFWCVSQALQRIAYIAKKKTSSIKRYRTKLSSAILTQLTFHLLRLCMDLTLWLLLICCLCPTFLCLSIKKHRLKMSMWINYISKWRLKLKRKMRIVQGKLTKVERSLSSNLVWEHMRKERCLEQRKLKL